MNPQLPSIAEGANRLRLGGQILVFAVLHIALVHKGLKVAAVFNSVGRVYVNALHLAAQALFLQQRVHYQQAVAGNQAVAPVAAVAVEFHGLAQGRVFLGRGKQRRLRAVAVVLPHGFKYQARLHALVHMQRNGGHLKRGVLGLAGPMQRGVQVRVVGVGLLANGVGVVLRRNQPHRRIVRPLLPPVLVRSNLALPLPPHPAPTLPPLRHRWGA